MPGRPNGLVTPEAVLLEFSLAGVGSRILARLIDLMVIAAALYAMFFALGLALLAGTEAESTVVIVLVVAVFLALFAYPVVFELWCRGRSIGKLALGLRVVTTAGGPVGFRAASTRAMLDLIDVFVSFGGIGLASMIVSSRGQRLGDMAAGTLVIRERLGAGTLAPVRFSVPYGYESFMARLDLARLRPADYALVRSLLLRSASLTPAARGSLAVQLATRVAERTGQSLPRELPPDVYLACVAAAYQQRSDARAGI